MGGRHVPESLRPSVPPNDLSLSARVSYGCPRLFFVSIGGSECTAQARAVSASPED
jgi:hypothetical protein